MILFVVLAVLLPWSLYRQMQENPVSRGSLLKLPLMFVGIGLLVQSGPLVPSGSGALLALTISVGASVLLGIWRGVAIPVWAAPDGTWMSKGNRLTITLWVALIGAVLTWILIRPAQAAPTAAFGEAAEPDQLPVEIAA